MEIIFDEQRDKMRKWIYALIIFFAEAEIALATSPHGEFRGHGEGKLSLSISKGNTITMTTFTHALGCGGAFAADGEMIAPNIMQARKQEDGKTCVLTLYFDKKFKAVSAKEDNCTFFHGAACGFDGVLKRMR